LVSWSGWAFWCSGRTGQKAQADEQIDFSGDVWLPHPFACATQFEGHVILTLESPITRTAERAPAKICLKAEAYYLLTTFDGSPLVVCLANNHVTDYGVEGLDDTVAELGRSGIGYVGAGPLARDCRSPLILEAGAVKVGLLGYVCPTTHPIYATHNSPGVSPTNLEKIHRAINALIQSGLTRIMVMLHWGM
jgi:poly-gamma-glutamate synthesis protein (capsule biosynthesis protein)